jgi:uncharacterized protein YjbI with pentapeptide repeats
MSERFKTPGPDELKRLADNKLHSNTEGREGSRAYFAFEDHEELDLAGAVLDEATLQETNFKRCRLDGASLYRALANAIRLDKASLENANFTRAEMEAAVLTGATATGATFLKAQLWEAKLDKGIFINANFQKANCIGASFGSSQLDGASFFKALLGKADFTGASLSGADFSGAVLTKETQFRDCRGLDQIVTSRIVIDDEVFEGDTARAAILRLAARQ